MEECLFRKVDEFWERKGPTNIADAGNYKLRICTQSENDKF